MDLNKFIPNTDNKWVIKKEILYYEKGGLIPLLKEIDNILFISLDRRVTKNVIKLINKLDKLEQPFLFCSRENIYQNHIYEEDFDQIIKSYLYTIKDETFYNFIVENDFDYVRNLTVFLKTYNCLKLFSQIYDHYKKVYFERKWTDWYTQTEHFEVKNESIRDFYSTLDRQVKLNIFFDS
jgi:hypothetical protein